MEEALQIYEKFELTKEFSKEERKVDYNALLDVEVDPLHLGHEEQIIHPLQFLSSPYYYSTRNAGTYMIECYICGHIYDLYLEEK
jgi:hypothetical protein